MTGRPLPEGMRFIERGWLNANHVVIDAPEGPILIDTGHVHDQQITLDRLRTAGVDPKSLSLIVNTHIHPDHWGGNRLLVELSGAPIACGADTAEAFARNDLRAMWADYFGNDLYHNRAQPPLTADRIWQIGEAVRLGAYEFEVLAAPGHAPDSIALWQQEHRVLVSADALHDGDCGVLHVAIHGQEIISDALETARAFRSLNAAVAVPGHGPLILDVADAIDRLEQRLLGFQRDPSKLARHLCGRVLMSSILAAQPVTLDDLCRLATDARWFDDYGHMLGTQDGAQLARLMVKEFRERNLVRVEDGSLIANMPR